MTARQRRNEIYKKRYHVLREMGYSAKEASRLRSRALDVDNIKLDDNGNVIKKNNFNKVVRMHSVDTYINDMSTKKNDTVNTRWGMYTHDKRYKDNTAKTVRIIQRDLRINNKQAYYFLYIMTTNGLTYEQTKQQLMSNQQFEMYRRRKGNL